MPESASRMSAEPSILFAAGIPTPTMKWRDPPESLPVLGDDVHLWRLSLARPHPLVIEEMEQTLSVDEQVRANRFHRALHRDRYVVGRASLRAILARYVGCPAVAMAFEYGRWGKPRLVG